MLRRSPGPRRVVTPIARRPLSLALAIALLAVAIAALALPAAASPANDLAAKRAEAQRIQDRIDAAQQRAEALDEAYLEAKNAVAAAQQQIADAEAQLGRAQDHASSLKQMLAARAAQLYISAGATDPFAFDAANVRELGSRAKYGEAAAQQDTRLLDELTLVQEQLNAQRRDLERARGDAQKREDAANKALTELKAATAQAQHDLAKVKGDIKSLVDKIAAQRAAEAEARARAAVAAQRSRGSGSDLGVDPGNIPAPSPGAAAAVAFARAQIGDPYVYAGAGPDTWDCSGLTMVAWAHGGVSMAHGAQSQYYSFPKVPISQLQPGDLVFFGNPIHHVGIYVGGGTMIEAPHTGAFVRYASIYRPDLVSLGSRP